MKGTGSRSRVLVCAYRIGGDEVGRFNRAARVSCAEWSKGTELGDVSRQEADDEGNLEFAICTFLGLSGRNEQHQELIRAGISVPNSPNGASLS